MVVIITYSFCLLKYFSFIFISFSFSSVVDQMQSINREKKMGISNVDNVKSKAREIILLVEWKCETLLFSLRFR